MDRGEFLSGLKGITQMAETWLSGSGRNLTSNKNGNFPQGKFPGFYGKAHLSSQAQPLFTRPQDGFEDRRPSSERPDQPRGPQGGGTDAAPRVRGTVRYGGSPTGPERACRVGNERRRPRLPEIHPQRKPTFERDLGKNSQLLPSGWERLLLWRREIRDLVTNEVGEGKEFPTSEVEFKNFHRPSKQRQQKIQDCVNSSLFGLHTLVYTRNQLRYSYARKVRLVQHHIYDHFMARRIFGLDYLKDFLDFSLLSLCKPCGDVTNCPRGHWYFQKKRGGQSQYCYPLFPKNSRYAEQVRNNVFLRRPRE
uniref:uncharacterized protein LOC118149984 n=1 Tax=Callithrix jacchus TaxID=9483 RepID=UPI0004F00462|nr:uncharacterized protein LOC118149984 [Callithrix jacchus]